MDDGEGRGWADEVNSLKLFRPGAHVAHCCIATSSQLQAMPLKRRFMDNLARVRGTLNAQSLPTICALIDCPNADAQRALLPDGYPRSVSEDYLSFQVRNGFFCFLLLCHHREASPRRHLLPTVLVANRYGTASKRCAVMSVEASPPKRFLRCACLRRRHTWSGPNQSA